MKIWISNVSNQTEFTKKYYFYDFKMNDKSPGVKKFPTNRASF